MIFLNFTLEGFFPPGFFDFVVPSVLGGCIIAYGVYRFGVLKGWWDSFE